jgi:hypothetical protein
MKSKLLGTVLGFAFAATLLGEAAKEFPAHWGKPPEIQTRDFVELPAGYGHGSSTLKRWIAANLEKDQAADKDQALPATTVLYRQDFQGIPAEKMPDEFMVLSGEFLVKGDGTNQFLELPGAPLDSFAVQFGPAGKDNLSARARVFGTVKGRRAPTFGVGLGGVSGFKLQVSPAKKALELLKDQELKASVSFDWKSGAWTQLRLQIRQLKDGAWSVEGKAWSAGGPEPEAWTISYEEKEEPVSGKASVLGSPFAGTPIWFDDLVVEKLGK